MPELPDVEVFKGYLDSTSLHERIRRIELGDKRLVKTSTPATLRRKLEGHELKASRRHGKYLFVELTSAGALVLHFGMTGYLYHYREENEPKSTQLRLDFDNGTHLAYVCVRKLGHIGWTKEINAFIKEHDLGPDAASIDLETFEQRLQGRSGAIKSTLMNQGVMAGLGNVYVDEILFDAHIDPRSSVDRLDGKKLRSIFRSMQKVVSRSITAEAQPSNMPRTWLLPHRESGAACPRGKGKIERIQVGGRSAYLCRSCQERL